MTTDERKASQNARAASFRARHGEEYRAYKRNWQRNRRAAERTRLEAYAQHPNPRRK
jgi:hypothetical protein